MDERIIDLYHLPDADELAQIHAMELREQCCYAEARAMEIIQDLPEEKRQVIEGYLQLRDDVEFYEVKMALRFRAKERTIKLPTLQK